MRKNQTSVTAAGIAVPRSGQPVPRTNRTPTARQAMPARDATERSHTFTEVNLGLLEQSLRDPHPIGVVRIMPPGQVTLVRRIPAQEPT